MQKKNGHQRPPRKTLDACFGGAPLVFYLRRKEGGLPFAYVSPNVLALLGHARENFEAKEDFWAACLHPDDRFHLLDQPSPLQSVGRAAVEYRLRDGQGNYRWIRDEPDRRAEADDDPFLAGYWQDITPLRQDGSQRPDAGSPLRIREPIAQELLDQLPQHLFWKDANGVFQGCNRAGAAALGLAHPREIVGKTDFDLYPDAAVANLLHHQDMAVLRSGIPRVHETVPAAANGESAWLDLTKVPLFDPDGRVRGLLISYQDVTAKKQAEISLRQFKQAVEQSSNTILITDAHGAITYVSPQFSKVYGYSAEEVIGRNPGLLKSGHTSAETYRALWEALWSGHSWHGEFLNRRKDGSLVWQVATLSPLLDEKNQITHFIAIEDDISEQKRIEASLRESEEKFRSLVEDAQLIAYEADPATFRFTYVSPQAEAILGFPLEEWYRDKFWADHLHPDDRAEAVNFCMTATLAGRDHRFEYRMIAQDGHEVWFDDPVRIIRGDDGTPCRIRGLMIDITERKQAELALRESEERFHRLVDVSEEGILIHDGKRLLDTNPALTRLFGYSREEMAALPLLALVAPAHQARVRNAIRQKRGTPYEIFCRRKDGSEFTAEVFGKSITYEGKPARVVTLRDITQRRALEQNLARLSRRHATLSRVNQLIAYCDSEKELFHDLCRSLVEVGHFKAAWVGMLAPHGDIRELAHWGPVKRLHLTPYSPCDPEHDPVAKAVAANDLQVCNDLSALPCTAQSLEETLKSGLLSIAVVPLRRDGRIVAVLAIYAGETGLFDTEHQAWLNQIGQHLSFALDTLDQQRQRRVAEKSLHESEERFRAIANYTYNWENWVDPQGRLRWVNPAVERITGYTPEECYAMDHFPLELIHPEDRDIALDHFHRTVTGEHEDVPLEFRFVRKDGAVRWGAVAWQNIYDSAGHHLGHRSSVRDITEQKLAVARLFDTQQMLQLVLDHVPQRVFWKDRDSVYQGGNRAFLEDLGLNDGSALAGKNDFDFYPAELAGAYRADDQAVMASETAKLDYEEHTEVAGLGQRHVLTNKLPIRNANGEVIGILGSYSDITETKRTREQLHDTLNELQTVLDNAQVGITLVRDRRVVWANRPLLAMFGYSLEEIQEQPARLFDPADDGSPFTPLDGNVHEHELRLRRRDGSAFWCHLRGSFLDPGALDKGSIWILLDIDRLKHAEDELRRLNETLEQRVREQTDKSLEQERLLIQQSRRAAMGEMIGNIAHQWRQPLNALGLVVQNMLLDYQEGTLDAQIMQGYITKARAMIQQMSTTIDDFRNFFRPSRTVNRYNLVQSIREALSLMEASFRNHNITATLEGPEEVVVLGHANEFAQIILNLVSNAKDALLEKNTLYGRIAIRVSATDKEAVITVEDNAGGIPSEIQERIFDPYFTTKASGTGIGLYMVKTILEQHMGGRISFANTADGTAFQITLPLQHEPASPGSSPPCTTNT
ncbi:MAG: PAS domain S-box protein [Sulfuricellaceae bacterium]|jgi:PAS domain S-box-containing protein